MTEIRTHYVVVSDDAPDQVIRELTCLNIDCPERNGGECIYNVDIDQHDDWCSCRQCCCANGMCTHGE